MNNNPFNIYTSKVKRFNIPLPEFTYFHKSSSEDLVDSKFIGREKSSIRLYSWLVEEKTKSGSYLITGYRGMGKSSFVGRVLHELSARVSVWSYSIGIGCFLLIWLCMLLSVDGDKFKFWMEITGLIGIILFTYYWYYIVNICHIFSFIGHVSKELFRSKKQGGKYNDYTLTEKVRILLGLRKNWDKDWQKINRELYNTNISKKSFRRICIKVNLGQEVLQEKEVLSLIVHELYVKYREYVQSPIANYVHWLIDTAIVFALGTSVYKFLSNFLIIKKTVWCANINIVDSYQFAISGYLPKFACLFVCYIVYQLFASRFLSTQQRILRKLNFLKKRIDASIDVSTNIGATNRLLTINSHKKVSHSVANIREIEQELIDILERINRGICHPSFILVFDELDKVEAETSFASQTQSLAPEYTSERHFPGGGTSRKRKQNVLHLLANMKLFVSSAKAKFIFIAGRELYDAYLADLSDREFAISSIFNGVIYVESFCSNERREKDIMSNAEAFICKQLTPHSYIKKENIRHYLKLKTTGKDFEKIDINLKFYYKYLINNYVKVYGDSMLYSNEELNDCHSRQDQLCNHDIRTCIDKAVVLLYHFSVYLYHISNGSPKKMTLYFEKYIRPTVNPTDFMLGHDTKYSQSVLSEPEINIRITEPAKFYLSFGYMDQRGIGFVHYISFPVTQIIINANQFGDKLLVSASFLIDHIYKFHNSGFSWRNLEHTPELLEVYRIPEFRDFINSIISYLTQTHLIPITCGLYQFKFRKQFSEEISLASKLSEEVAALFNFTLDESQSVKQHYFEIQEDYNKRMEQEQSDSPHAKAGIHNILADLYMSDEEYTKAIFEYQTAIQIISSLDSPKMEENFSNPHYISHVLFLIRNMLKLGLAFEKRKTYESAYITYNELIGRLINFRYLNESQLGLKYIIEKDNNWPPHKAVLYANEDSESIAEQTVLEKVRPKIIEQLSATQENSLYVTNGPNIITDFAHQMTIEKNPIIQRLSMLEDIRLVYQAVLAKMFVLEKIELGGITRTNVELLESEYVFLHLATNEKDKFLISTDFFRRLGDIMFYKNGLTGGKIDVFSEGLYYWTYNARTEVLDFCNLHKCYHLKNELLTTLETITNNEIGFEAACNSYSPVKLREVFLGKWKTVAHDVSSPLAELFCNNMIEQLSSIPMEEVARCNKHRKEMWNKNRPLPCYACKYYNRSLRLVMNNLFGIDIEQECQKKHCSKTLVILQQIIEKGTSASLRQNFIIQFAEVLDCMGNVMLSCALTSEAEDAISEKFLSCFLADIYEINKEEQHEVDYQNLQLYEYYKKKENRLTKLERCLMYYWEASMCFRIGSDLKKASDSLKKILRTLQNYLKIKGDDKAPERKKVLIGEFLNEIKNRIVKRALMYLYSHYDFINIIEIQKLKWVFYVHMYEDISLNRLSLFPDIEEIMWIYYEMIRSCIVKNTHDSITIQSEREKSWENLFERNMDFQIRLTGIYRNIALGSLRIESTIYERVLSLRFKSTMNQHILHHVLSHYGWHERDSWYYESNFVDTFVECLEAYLMNPQNLQNALQEYMACFPHVFSCVNENYDKDQSLYICLTFLEFLIKDSMYCLTKILEIITPYTATTLFTNSFLGDIYQKLYEWNQLFDALFMTYKAIESVPSNIDSKCYYNTYYPLEKDDYIRVKKCPHMNRNTCRYSNRLSKNMPNEEIKRTWLSRCPYYDVECEFKHNPLEHIRSLLKKKYALKENLESYAIYSKKELADYFFNDVLKEIGKSNIHYTLNNYSAEMSLKFYRKALEMHHEGKSYKDMIAKMYYLDDDLKNDTIQFDSAIERFKINNGYINDNINKVLDSFRSSSIYDIENFCVDNESELPLQNRFL